MFLIILYDCLSLIVLLPGQSVIYHLQYKLSTHAIDYIVILINALLLMQFVRFEYMMYSSI